MKNPFGSSWVSVFAIFTAALSMLFSLCNNAGNAINETRIDQIVDLTKARTMSKFQKDSIVQKISADNFKDDFYVNQLSVQSDWIILYVSALFGIFGIVGFVVFDKKIEQIQKDHNELKEKYQSHYAELLERFNFLEKHFESKFNNLQIQNYDLISNIYTLSSEFSFEKNMQSNSFDDGLAGAFYMANSILMMPEGDVKNEKIARCLHLLDQCYRHLDTILKDIEKFTIFMFDFRYERYIDLLNGINKTGNTEITNKQAQIRVRILRILEQVQEHAANNPESTEGEPNVNIT